MIFVFLDRPYLKIQRFLLKDSFTILLVLYSSSVYRPSPRSVCYTVWRYCGLVSFSYHLMVTERLQPQSLCIVVNQLDTA